MKSIFDRVSFNNLDAKNRLVRSATWEALADRQGHISDEVYEIYQKLAEGGIGTIITGFTSVSSDDHYFEGMMRLSDDELMEEYRKLVDIIHKEDVRVITQLALGAYYVNDFPFEPDYMETEYIEDVVRLFAEASKRAEKIGFDGVQIHAAHFFFLSRFISPESNHRSDEYGGSTDKRIRILVEIIEKIKCNSPNLHLTIKINSDDFTAYGLMPEESLEICKKLAKIGLDSIEVSGNGTSVGGIRPHVNEAYFLDFAKKLAQEVDIPVILVGGLRSKETMEDILNNTEIELLSLSRPLIYDADFPNKLKNGEVTESGCVSCNRCYRTHAHKCIFNQGD